MFDAERRTNVPRKPAEERTGGERRGNVERRGKKKKKERKKRGKKRKRRKEKRGIGWVEGQGGKKGGVEGRRRRVRRYATEYYYPDNRPAISSAACINLRVKGQDARYLNK